MHNNAPTHALIIGYGSIGSRHARLLAPHCTTLSIVTAREDVPYQRFASLEKALADVTPNYIVICTATAQHAASGRG